MNNEDCNKALKRIQPKIDMEEINLIIDETPYITELQKKFYKTILMERKEKILNVSFEKLRKRELAKQTE